MKKKIYIIVQARMSSSRLPKKVLMQLKDKTVLGHIITRLKKVENAVEVIIATSLDKSNDPIENECKKYDVKVFRGDLDDVLSRFYNAAISVEAEHIVRICGDNPFMDHHYIDEVLEFYNNNSYEYIRTEKMPIGIGFEVFSFKALQTAYEKGDKPYEREHVTPYIIENEEKAYTHYLKEDLSNYRLTLDTESDFELIKALYDRIYDFNNDFSFYDCIECLKREPSLMNINKHIVQRTYK